MKKPTSDLTRRIQRKRQRKLFKLTLILVLGGLLVSWLPSLRTQLPWHWQLFLRWLTHGGDVTEIPKRLYPELSQLCHTANNSGVVNGYQASDEIAYSLGKFECRRLRYENRWIIRDIYRFGSLSEAKAGTPFAVFLVKLVGTDYFYFIDASFSMDEYSNSGQ